MLILSEHSCSSVVPIVKIIMSNFVYVKYSSLLNTLKGNCFDDEQYVVRTAVVRKPGLGLGFGLVVLVLVLVLRIWSYSHHCPFVKRKQTSMHRVPTHIQLCQLLSFQIQCSNNNS